MITKKTVFVVVSDTCSTHVDSIWTDKELAMQRQIEVNKESFEHYNLRKIKCNEEIDWHELSDQGDNGENRY